MLHKRTLAQLVALVVIVSLVGLPSAAASATANPPSLGMADSFAVLAHTEITNIPTSAITGDVGLSPAAGSNYTGLTAVEVTGTIYAVDATGPAGSVANPGLLTTAKTDLETAYNALAVQTCTTTYPGGSKELSGSTLVPGVYCADAFTLSGVLTLDGADTDVWIFKSAATLIVSGVTDVVLLTGGEPCEVWWQVGSSATLGTDTSLAGNILAYTSITLASRATLNGRALARTAAVTMDQNTIAIPICEPSAVELLYFQAHPLSGQQVQLQWATALEVDNFGFNLYRAAVNDLRGASLIHFEPASTQGGGSGATYAYVDTAPYAGRWWYWLSDVDTYGRETFHNTPINITVQSNALRYHIYLPFIGK